MAFDLSSIRRGKSSLPPRIVVYGEHGIGKSTFGAGAPAPIFIPTEDGLGAIDTASFPLCKSYSDVLGCIGTLYQEEHDFRTVILDSLDWTEGLIWKHVCDEHGKQGIEGFDFGKGYTYAADVMRQMLDGFNALRTKRQMCVILIAHSQVKRFDDPTAGSYERFQLKLHRHASAIVSEWADVIGFAQHRLRVHKEDVGFNKKIARAVEAGERVLGVERSPAYDAKNRMGLPKELPLGWQAFAEALSAA